MTPRPSSARRPDALPVVMHFPGRYEPGETRQYQLSQHLAARRDVIYVADEDGLYDSWRPDPHYVVSGAVGRVTVVTRHLSRSYRRLCRRVPRLAAALNERSLRRCLRALGRGACWTYVFGPSHEWAHMRPPTRMAVEVADPPFVGDAGEFWRRTGAICRRADLVVATASQLVDDLASQGVAAVCVANAVSAELITDVHGVRSSPPVAAYIGAIDWRFDHELVADVARSLPSIEFVLAGRINAEVEADLADLRSLPNVELLGTVPEPTKRDILRGASVGLVPFRAGPLSDGVNPTKVYEYAAYGLPVVSVASRACRELSPPVRAASGVHEFADSVRAAIHDPPDPQEISAFARANTWDDRARRIDDLFSAREAAEPVPTVPERANP